MTLPLPQPSPCQPAFMTAPGPVPSQHVQQLSGHPSPQADWHLYQQPAAFPYAPSHAAIPLPIWPQQMPNCAHTSHSMPAFQQPPYQQPPPAHLPAQQTALAQPPPTYALQPCAGFAGPTESCGFAGFGAGYGSAAASVSAPAAAPSAQQGQPPQQRPDQGTAATMAAARQYIGGYCSSPLALMIANPI